MTMSLKEASAVNKLIHHLIARPRPATQEHRGPVGRRLMAVDALFELPAGARVEREPLQPMTPGERMRTRQLDRLTRGIHPLSKPGWPPISLHRDAAPALDKDAPGLRCGDCRFRQSLGHHNRDFPKCVLPDCDGDRMRATHSASSDVRKWWPACRDYQPKDAD